MMKRHLVLIGGGHAHMLVMQQLDTFTQRGHNVTLASPAPYHYYSGMGPGLLGGMYREPQVRFHIEQMISDRGGRFVEDRVVRIDAIRRQVLLASGACLDYDVASLNVGSEIAVDGLCHECERVIRVKPIVNLAQARRRLLAWPGPEPLRLAVVGGGPAGVEVAGNLARLLEENGRPGEVALLAGTRLLPTFPAKVRRRVLTDFQARAIAVHEGRRVSRIEHRSLVMSDASRLPFDMAFLATGVRPPAMLRDSGLTVGDDGGLLVNRHLQSTTAPALFGGGDCISFAEQPLAKVGVHAVRQNPILLHNLLAALEDRPLKTFSPQKHYLLIFNLGTATGSCIAGELCSTGASRFASRTGSTDASCVVTRSPGSATKRY